MEFKVTMTAQDGMKECLAQMLKERAEQDELFAKSFFNTNKSMDECFRFIMGEVAKANEDAIKAAMKDRKNTAIGVGFDNEWIMNKAIHYFDESDIEVPEEMDFSAYMPKDHQKPSNTTPTHHTSPVSRPYQAPVIPIKPKAAPKFGEDTLFFGLDDDDPAPSEDDAVTETVAATQAETADVKPNEDCNNETEESI